MAFVENINLWRESGYFDNAADTKPLLHIWSLGIEEQFYMVWPFLLWAASRTRLSYLGVTVAVGAVSFVLNLLTVNMDPTGDFYLPQTRFWELLTGGALACLHIGQLQPRALGADASQARAKRICDLATLDARLVARRSSIPVLARGSPPHPWLAEIDRSSAFPGWWALAPARRRPDHFRWRRASGEWWLSCRKGSCLGSVSSVFHFIYGTGLCSLSRELSKAEAQ